MTQTIKPNDLVYVPSVSSRLHQVYLKNGNMELKVAEDEFYIINTQGQKLNHEIASWSTQSFAFLATPEMKEKLEQVYGKLEDIPVDEGLEKFCREIDLLRLAQDLLSISAVPINNIYRDSEQTKQDKLVKQVKTHRENLIQMFKERGLSK